VNTIETLLKELVARGGSDLHVVQGDYPRARIAGKVVPLYKVKLDRAFFERMLQKVMKTDNAIVKLFEKEEVDLTFEVPSVGRFRVNIGLARGVPFAVFRELKTVIPYPRQLGIPQEFVDVVERIPYGLIFVGGTTGSGKSTTLASVLNYLLKKHAKKVITIEDPVEYLIGAENELAGYVIQREVGRDTKSFASALRAAMRQDPDYIVVGEVRDVETARYCVVAAETGHTVLTTIHVKDAVSAVGRFVGIFPTEEQNYLKMRLIDQLEAVQVQLLVLGKDGKRHLATELLIFNEEVKELFLRDESRKVRRLMEEGKCGWTMRQSLEKLWKEGIIDEETFKSYSVFYKVEEV